MPIPKGNFGYISKLFEGSGGRPKNFKEFEQRLNGILNRNNIETPNASAIDVASAEIYSEGNSSSTPSTSARRAVRDALKPLSQGEDDPFRISLNLGSIDSKKTTRGRSRSGSRS